MRGCKNCICMNIIEEAHGNEYECLDYDARSPEVRDRLGTRDFWGAARICNNFEVIKEKTGE